jgi:uncharacterized protein YndB with AHSA1/START domain
MQNMKFNIDINATREKIWKALWEDASYREWTSVFTEGSYAITDNWKQGTKVLFLDSKGCGMVGIVAENKPNEFMSFKHIGEVQDGIEDTTSDKIKQWSGAIENYTLTETGNGTELQIEMAGNLSADFVAYFSDTWPKALDKLKEIAEAG